MFRNTRQKLFILQATRELCHPNATEIYTYVKKKCPSISQGTVYRVLNMLVQTNKLLHIQIPNRADCYDWNNTNHYHLTCKRCGKIADVDIKYIPALNQLPQSNCLIEGHTILFSGICPHCHQSIKGEKNDDTNT